MTQLVTPPPPTKSGVSGLRRRLQRLMLVLAAVAGMANAAQAQGIEINDTNFPDENFRNWVLAQNYGADAILTDEEIAAVTNINVSNKNITDLKGIEHFTALTELFCFNNQLTELDVSKNTALTKLWCDNNQLTALDVSANTALTELSCDNNQLTALDVSKNTALTQLWCGNNQLTALDLSANTALTQLWCANNQLTTLDVSANTALTRLHCRNNQLTTLDVSANTALTFLICSYNQLTSLDVSANTQLTKLYCNSNQLTALDVSKNITLTTLECYSNQIQGNEMLALVNRLPSVTSGEFYVVDTKDSKEKNSITKAQVAIATGKNWTVYDYNRNNKVEYAGDPGIEINETNFPDNNFRSYVSTSYDTDSDNYLSYEEVAAVTYIGVSNKNIADLKGIEHFTALTGLSCGSNQLTTLDLSKNTALTQLDCQINQLTTLDVSKNTALKELNCYHNLQLTTLDLSANTALTYLNCGSNQLTTLDVSKNTALTRLYCYRNRLTTLDVSANTALTYLDCELNHLTTLDVSANTALTQLRCNNNQLTTLGMSANTALTGLDCSGNQIKANEMLALVNNLPTVTSGWFYVVDTQNSIEGNVITKSQVAIATGKNWKVYDYNDYDKIAVEYAGDPGIEINETNFPDNNFRNHVSTSYDTDSDNYLSYEEVAAVTNIDVSNKNIADLKGIEHFTALSELYCYKNQLTALNVSANIALTDLACDNNQLTTLDVSKNTALTRLYCYNNQLTTLDVLANTALTYLDCERNQLTALDVSKNTALKTLYCYKNQLTALNVSANIALTDLSCDNNQLTTLDVSKNTALTGLECYSNQIKGDEMLALVNSLPIVTSGRFYVVDTQDSDEGNVITKSQVAIATGKNWKVYDYNGKNKVEYAGVEEYVLTIGNSTNGTLMATPNGNITEGTEVTLTATPDEGYMLKTLKAYRTGDESQTVAISENKFTMPAHDVTVEAEFEAITYTLTYAAGEGGTIQGSATQTVAHGQSGTEVEAKADEGYKFVKWSDGLTTAKRTDSNVQGNINVMAEFEKTNTTGIFNSKFESLSAYPNPTMGMLWVSVPELAEGTAAEVLVYNATGQLLQRVAARAASTGSAASRLSIDLSGYPAGMYIIQVGNAVAKVLKQ